MHGRTENARNYSYSITIMTLHCYGIAFFFVVYYREQRDIHTKLAYNWWSLIGATVVEYN